MLLIDMIYINVLHQIDHVMKLIVIKSFIYGYPYSKDRYKSFTSHPKYHSYYFSLECNNSIKIASSPNGGSIPLGTTIMLLSLLLRSGASTTIEVAMHWVVELTLGWFLFPYSTLFVVMLVLDDTTTVLSSS